MGSLDNCLDQWQACSKEQNGQYFKLLSRTVSDIIDLKNIKFNMGEIGRFNSPSQHHFIFKAFGK